MGSLLIFLDNLDDSEVPYRCNRVTRRQKIPYVFPVMLSVFIWGQGVTIHSNTHTLCSEMSTWKLGLWIKRKRLPPSPTQNGVSWLLTPTHPAQCLPQCTVLSSTERLKFRLFGLRIEPASTLSHHHHLGRWTLRLTRPLMITVFWTTLRTACLRPCVGPLAREPSIVDPWS